MKKQGEDGGRGGCEDVGMGGGGEVGMGGGGKVRMSGWEEGGVWGRGLRSWGGWGSGVEGFMWSLLGFVDLLLI